MSENKVFVEPEETPSQEEVTSEVVSEVEETEELVKE